MMEIKNWEYYPLKQITSKIGSGATPTGGKSAYKESGITLIRSLNVYDFKFKYKDLAFIDDEQARKLSNVKIEKNDILLNITGASVCRCTSVPNHLLPARVNQHVSIIRVNSAIANYKYVLYALNNPPTKSRLLNIAQTGATREALTKEDIENFQLHVPQLPTQKKIAHILSSYDDLIENNQKRIVILEQMAQNLYKEWFVRFRFPGWEEVEFVDGVPRGWEKKPLGNISNVTFGQSPKSEFYNEQGLGLPFHQGVKDFNDRFPYHFTYCTDEKRIAYKGDILFSVRAPVGRLNLSDRKIIIGRGVAAFRHKNNLQSYLFYLLNHVFSIEDLIGNGAIFNSVGKEELLSYKVLTPNNIDLATEFHTKASVIDKQIEILFHKNLILKKERNRLLPRLLSGKLKV